MHHFHANQSLPAFNAAIVGSVPLGGGVSSSASVEVATYTMLEELVSSKAASDKSKALACQSAEHSHAGLYLSFGFCCNSGSPFSNLYGLQIVGYESVLLTDWGTLNPY